MIAMVTLSAADWPDLAAAAPSIADCKK